MFRSADLEREWTGRHGGRGGYADAVVSAAVLFDLDGTLIDRRAAAVIALRTSLGYSGPVDPVDLANLELDGSPSNDRTWMFFSLASARSLSNAVDGFVSSCQSWVSPW